ncbi:MAG: DUF899 domain-containing protein [Pseudomonadota bacterium]
MPQHRIVSRDEWLAARKALLAKEKELTRLRDRLNAERRALPWVRVEKSYLFDTPRGKRTLSDLFEGRSQLFVQHFMFAPDWEEGCIGCSFAADHIDGAVVHLEHHDVTFVAVSRAPLAKLQAYKKRMGWRFKWVSSEGSDFNYDYHVSFTKEELAKGKVYYNYEMIDAAIEDLPGASVFYKDEKGDIYHTYSAYARGGEELLGTYVILDATPKGRNETGPHYNLMDWVKRRDQYEDGKGSSSCCASGEARQQERVRA